MASFIHDFGILFLIIVFFSFIIKIAKQPIIIGYVIAGLFFSFYLTDPSRSEQIVVLSELGITFLLFLMGLEFDLKSLKYLGKDILIVTIQQSLIFFGLAFGIAKLFGFSIISSVYIGILFMFSSTLLVAKWIDDKKETNTLYGKITLGILIVQDVIAIIALSFLSVIQEKSIIKIFIAPLTGIALLVIVVLFARYALNWLLKFTIKYPELLFIFSLGVCFFFVEIAPILGYSETIGAFLAGIIIANTAYKNDVYTRLKPLIVFFNMLFFVGLGFQINTTMTLNLVLVIALLCLLSLTVKPFVIYYTLKRRGYDIKTAFITGLNLAQLSEFGSIIIMSGIASGVINGGVNAIAVISIILTMILSSYLIKYDKQIFKYFEPHLKKIESKFKDEDFEKMGDHHKVSNHNIIFFGYHDIGKELYSKIDKMGKKLLVIENDPQNIEILKKEKVAHIYNSVNNPDFFEKIDLSKSELVISSIIDIEDNKMIIKQAKRHNAKCTVIVTAKSLKDSLDLYANNADYVICPFYLNEQQVSVLLEDYTTDINKVITKKINDITQIKEIERKKLENRKASAFLDIDSFFKRISKKPENVPKKKTAQSLLDTLFGNNEEN